MLKRNFFTLVVALIAAAAVAQTSDEKTTTIILVRHAEKVGDGSADPELSADGAARAQRLAAILKRTGVNAVYATNYKRTRNTVQPAAAQANLQVQTYEPLKADAMDRILASHPGQTVLIAGHSNTVPWTVNYLVGKDNYKNFEDSEYDNLIVVTLTTKGNAKVTWLSY